MTTIVADSILLSLNNYLNPVDVKESETER